MRPNNESDFWVRVRKTTSCWIWEGGKNNDGYGRFRWMGKFYRAHRLAWQLFNGEIPPGKFICHHCDNPLCVNPQHLFIGTPEDNMRDMAEKDRHVRGERSPQHKLEDRSVLYIRKAYKTNNKTLTKLGNEFGVSAQCIYSIIHNHTWKHILAKN